MRKRPGLGTLVVMGRLPQVGVGKRRLARDVGNLVAWRFYRITLFGLLRRLARDPRWRLCLAVTPDSGVRQFQGLPSGVQLLPQGRGDLGRRMGRMLRAFPDGPVVIVGSDIPNIESSHIRAAFRALGRYDWVFGPAADGGYWLVGASRRAASRALPFGKVRWSSAHALADTLARLAEGSFILIEELEDVDSGADLARVNRRP